MVNELSDIVTHSGEGLCSLSSNYRSKATKEETLLTLPLTHVQMVLKTYLYNIHYNNLYHKRKNRIVIKTMCFAADHQ